jgi:hypothetical protein
MINGYPYKNWNLCWFLVRSNKLFHFSYKCIKLIMYMILIRQVNLDPTINLTKLFFRLMWDRLDICEFLFCFIFFHWIFSETHNRQIVFRFFTASFRNVKLWFKANLICGYLKLLCFTSVVCYSIPFLLTF